MKRYLGVSIVLLCLLFLLPLATVVTHVVRREAAEEPAAKEETKIELLPPGETDGSYTIRVLKGDKVETMTMGEYLQGVVRAEMPASFEQQALCAQAVAARTYTLYKMASGGNHGDLADICTDHTCCQAYLDKETATKNWGDNAENYEAKVENAVSLTDGQTILYDGVPVLAVFHSSSAGQTKKSGEVWTSDLPYLQSVSSPEGEGVPNYYSRVEFTFAEFKKLFMAAYPEADLSGRVSGWFGERKVSEDGNVDSVTVGGVSVRGTQMRTIFSLRSTTFETEIQDGKIVFFVTGYGHGVGMSQYGAQQMAKDGSGWKDIITHYYTGVTVAVYIPEAMS
ncbi:stage II sporulation protein D [Oscillibacter ruminantium]|jgi:stage II sporulation protein D|uniref:stage II sporulation protein D n=1 Tax=Oscillibacter ruminantium TaxID=1263547 RepID=UPI0025AA3686|nr:stage II sporulation protein D [Oscillibacter valericigenes]